MSAGVKKWHNHLMKFYGQVEDLGPNIPPSLNWLIFDATIAGDTKEACTGSGQV